jgi:UDP-N-acetylglucosamine 2-epimerase
MRVLLVGNSDETSRLAQLLDDGDLALERRVDGGSEPSGGPEEIAAIASALREFERVLGEGGPDAVLVASDSSASLAAVLIATKLRTPVAGIEPAGSERYGANARLIRRLSDAELAPEAAAISNWLRGTYTHRR